MNSSHGQRPSFEKLKPARATRDRSPASASSMYAARRLRRRSSRGRLAVGADDRPFARAHRPDRAGHHTVPVQVAAAVEVAATGDRHRRAIGVAYICAIRSAHDLQTSYGCCPCTACLRVRQLAARRRPCPTRPSPFAYGRAAAARFEQSPRCRRCCLERRDRIAIAMPTMVCAARWKTVSISYSPRTRSSSA